MNESPTRPRIEVYGIIDHYIGQVDNAFAHFRNAQTIRDRIAHARIIVTGLEWISPKKLDENSLVAPRLIEAADAVISWFEQEKPEGYAKLFSTAVEVRFIHVKRLDFPWETHGATTAVIASGNSGAAPLAPS